MTISCPPSASSGAIQRRLFIVGDHASRREAMVAEVAPALRDGRIRYRETVVEGLEQAPEAFMVLLRGENTGKMVVKL